LPTPAKKKGGEGRRGGGKGLGDFLSFPKNLKPPSFFPFPPPSSTSFDKFTAGWIEGSGVVVANVIRKIAVVNEVSVVSISRIILAASGDGLVLASGLAPENGAETAENEKKR